MSTVCFDIKRVDDNYVCIQHCNINKFEYDYHLGLSFYPREINGKSHWWLTDKKYRYIWVAIKESTRTGIETPVWVSNDKRWFNNSIKNFFKEKKIRIIKLPWDIKVGNRWEENDMGDKFKLYCPIKLNEDFHIYADHYEEIEPLIEGTYEIGGKTVEFKTRQFKWIPPKYIGEK